MASLALKTSEEHEGRKNIMVGFESRNLSGQAVTGLVNQEGNNPDENRLLNALKLLDPVRFDRLIRT